MGWRAPGARPWRASRRGEPRCLVACRSGSASPTGHCLFGRSLGPPSAQIVSVDRGAGRAVREGSAQGLAEHPCGRRVGDLGAATRAQGRCLRDRSIVLTILEIIRTRPTAPTPRLIPRSRAVECGGLRRQPVADTSHRLDQICLVSKLFAKPMDHRVDDVGSEVVLEAPDRGEKLAAGTVWPVRSWRKCMTSNSFGVRSTR